MKSIESKTELGLGAELRPEEAPPPHLPSSVETALSTIGNPFIGRNNRSDLERAAKTIQQAVGNLTTEEVLHAQRLTEAACQKLLEAHRGKLPKIKIPLIQKIANALWMNDLLERLGK